MLRHFPAVVLIAVLAGAPPALAQFGTIFGNEPPRPPCSVTGGRARQPQSPQSPPPGLEQAPSPLPQPPARAQRPPGGIESQPLPPPPGGAGAPQQTGRPVEQLPPG